MTTMKLDGATVGYSPVTTTSAINETDVKLCNVTTDTLGWTVPSNWMISSEPYYLDDSVSIIRNTSSNDNDKPITDYPSYITKVGLSGVYETFEMLTMDKLMSLRLDAKKYVNYIKKIIVNDKAVIILWKDSSKTTAVIQGDDEFNLERGIEICIMKRLLGSSYHKLIKEGIKKYHELEAAKQAEIDAKQAEKVEREIKDLRRQEAERQKRNDHIYEISQGVKRGIKELASEVEEVVDEKSWKDTVEGILESYGFEINK